MAAASLVVCPSVAWAWGQGHGWIRRWAVARLPERQTEYFGKESLAALGTKYLSLQDAHAGGARADLDPYCRVPDVRLSLHDVNPPLETLRGIQWYLEQVCRRLQAGENDEAMKYLGVLCHWCEDPGSLSAHSSPVDEATLRQLLPPPAHLENRNYLFGAGWIGLEEEVGLEEEDYRPRLLGRSIAEAAVLITRQQRVLRRRAAGLIVPALIGRIEDDPKRWAAAIGSALNYNARFIADVLYTVGCLAQGHVDAEEARALDRQPLTHWLAEPVRGRTSHPYYVLSFLVDQSMDAERRLHPLELPGQQGPERIAFGLGMGTPCRLEYELPLAGVYAKFVTRVGLHPTAGPKGQIVFTVHVDGQPAATATLAAGQAAVELTVPLPERPLVCLTLEAAAAPDSEPTHNLAVWAEPTLLKSRKLAEDSPQP